MFRQLFEAHFCKVLMSNELARLRLLIIFDIIFLNSKDPVMWTALGSAMGLSLNLSRSLKHPLSLLLLSFILASSFSNNSVVTPKLDHFPHGFIVNFLKDGVAKCYTHV